ncbi:uncharacterized protein LOC111364434 [Spodoptera litura]|uniref:Uncharacterized protein LOC111364434 n=1 Tax=Spodoptera litura TaxID=69820 RepID=A0A9J7EVL8_SPOLT|nr:uncharacterized protein LOC111364434 [Spodoptera litura]
MRLLVVLALSLAVCLVWARPEPRPDDDFEQPSDQAAEEQPEEEQPEEQQLEEEPEEEQPVEEPEEEIEQDYTTCDIVELTDADGQSLANACTLFADPN